MTNPFEGMNHDEKIQECVEQITNYLTGGGVLKDMNVYLDVLLAEMMVYRSVEVTENTKLKECKDDLEVSDYTIELQMKEITKLRKELGIPDAKVTAKAINHA